MAEDVALTAGRTRGVDPVQALDADAVRLPLQPPLQRLESRACVVFSLG